MTSLTLLLIVKRELCLVFSKLLKSTLVVKSEHLEIVKF